MTSIVGPLGIDPLYFALALFAGLLVFVLYLLLPRGFRVHYFASYPKRYPWSAKPRRIRKVSYVTCVCRVRVFCVAYTCCRVYFSGLFIGDDFGVSFVEVFLLVVYDTW